MNDIDGRMTMKQNVWMTGVFFALLINMMVVSVAVAASPLAQPKADGLIGEQANGYIGLVSQNVPAKIKNLVNDVNAGRKATYHRIAKQQDLSLVEVEKIAAKATFEKTLRGNYVRDASGAWRKK